MTKKQSKELTIAKLGQIVSPLQKNRQDYIVVSRGLAKRIIEMQEFIKIHSQKKK